MTRTVMRTDIQPAVERVYEFIVKYKREHDGNTPTFREICKAVGLRSTNTIWYHLKALEKRGLIRRTEPGIGVRFSTNIEIIGGEWRLRDG